MHTFTKMYEMESTTYAEYHSNIWSSLIDVILCIQGHMFWIYSAIFCFWDESNNSLLRLDDKKISPRFTTPSKPASESKWGSDKDTAQKPKIPPRRLDLAKQVAPPQLRGYSCSNRSSPSLTTTEEKITFCPDMQLESPGTAQRKRRDPWQATITHIIKRRESKNQIHPLEPIIASSSVPSLPNYTEYEPVARQKTPRRLSAPTVSRVRDSRPSIHEERNGITKPPRWWRKMTTVGWKRRNTA